MGHVFVVAKVSKLLIISQVRAEAVRKIMDNNGFYSSRPPVEYAAAAPGLYVGEGKMLPF